MASTSEQFITQMKLRELRLQREKTLAAYAALARESREVAGAQGDAAALRLLYERLREMKFANQPLHPDVANLELLLREIDLHPAATETVRFWRERLERELTRGELRSEIVYVFGRLLEERLSAPTVGAPDPEQVAAQQALVAQFASAGNSETVNGGAPLESVFTAIGLDTSPLAEYLRYATEEAIYEQVEWDELKPILEQISHDVTRDSAVRREARRALANETLMRELADALTIALAHLEEWAWPTDGVTVRAHWTQTKWRLYLDEDLPNACLLQLLGERWQTVLQEILGRSEYSSIDGLENHLPLTNGRLIGRRDRQLLLNTAGLTLVRDVDIWAGVGDASAAPGASAEANDDDDDEEDDGIDDDDETWAGYYGIRQRRGQFLDTLYEFETGDGYASGKGTSRMDAALTLLNAEIALRNAAFPKRPLYVAKLDVKDFAPSLSHNLLLMILARLGLPERDLAFFRRYLRAPMLPAASDGAAVAGGGVADAPVMAQRGVFSHRNLAYFLVELVMRLLDQSILRAGAVEVIRELDDIGLVAASQAELSKAVRAAREFLAACGLELNAEKCGYVVIGGADAAGDVADPALADLAARNPSWMMLTLDGVGEWRVNPTAFETYLARARRDLLAEPTLLPRVARYNANITYLQAALSIKSPLGDTHRRSVCEALARFHYDFFGEGRSIVDEMRGLIAERYLEARTAITLPEAWLYWPITAGGLGLKQAVMLAASFAEVYAAREMEPPQKPRTADLSRKSNDWARWYMRIQNPVAPTAPEPNTVMETLVNDFISRGSQISGGKQQSLSAYWRWALYVYGPQILDSLGSFRFLFTELVPIQLILERNLDDEELTDDDSDDE